MFWCVLKKAENIHFNTQSLFTSVKVKALDKAVNKHRLVSVFDKSLAISGYVFLLR